jgi:hypothetical protein
MKSAWESCPRGDWLLWIAARAGVDRKAIVLAACDCAALALRFVPPCEQRPRIAIATTRKWARGRATIEQVRAAAYAAAAAAAADAAYAAYAAADAAYAAYAAYAAADAAYAAAAAAANAAYAAAANAQSKSLAKCAVKVRSRITFQAVLSSHKAAEAAK